MAWAKGHRFQAEFVYHMDISRWELALEGVWEDVMDNAVLRSLC